MSRICAIMQPTYLPWAGYFNLINSCDFFVFLDDVQFAKQSWQNRNKILIGGKSHWLTVPVRRKRLNDKIYNIKIDDTQKWRMKHIRSIKQSYNSHNYYEQLRPILKLLNNTDIQYLSKLNINVIRYISNVLNIDTSKFYLSSEFKKTGTRSVKLLDIIKELDCDTYLSPVGSKRYIEDDMVLNESGVKVVYQDYVLNYYKQKNIISHISHLSIIDIIANIGLNNCEDFVKR